MKPTLRQSMDFLHTWTGVLFGALLFLIFFMGTLAVFDREIDRWMLPETRLPPPPSEFSFDRRVLPRMRVLAPPSSAFWFVTYPDARTPTMQLGWKDPASGKRESRRLDVAGGRLLHEPGSWGGTGFFYPFHYNLHLPWKDLGIWIVGFAAMAMLTALVSGVIVHRKLFADFFTFRAQSSRHRATLDVHNFSSVLLLPFHFLISLSGLIVFFTIYMPAAIHLLYGGDTEKYFDDAFSQVRRPPAGQPAALGSVDAMVREARRRWGDGEVRSIWIEHPGDRAAVVGMGRAPRDRVAYVTHTLYFDGTSGAVLKEDKPSTAMTIQNFLTGLHLVAFHHWWLRWLYFLMGLASCVMIATGMLLWVDKRARRHRMVGLSGWRVVDAAGCAGSLGVIVATLAMLIANRLIAEGIAYRPQLEAGFFFAAWIACGAHAWLRTGPAYGRRAWAEQTVAIAALALAAPLLNWITTGDHVAKTVTSGQWAVGGMDLVLLASGLAAARAAHRI
jgi:uncharacterized iron-regulated membrane protein